MKTLNTVSRDDSILYELLVYSEWQQDPELTRGDYRPPAPSRTILQRIIGLFYQKLTLTEHISEQIGCGLPWQFAAGEGGKVVAVLQDTLLEIRISKDEYCAVVGKASLPRDPWPQWRKLAWSPDCGLLAIASSNGAVGFYNLLASNVFNIAPDCKQTTGTLCMDTTHAIAAILFVQSRLKGHKWSSEVLLIDYSGNLRSYLVSPDGCQLNHRFSFESYYKGGVSSAGLHPSHPVLIVSGRGNGGYGRDHLRKLGSSAGLSTWRLLNDSPFYKLSMDSEEQRAIQQKSWTSWKNTDDSVIFKVEISPCGKLVACLHSCGSVSTWNMPTLRLVNMWQLVDQPEFDLKSPLLENKKMYQGIQLTKMSPNVPIDINWWSESAVILVRYNGAVSVNSITDLRNLLGDKPEFLSGQPQVTQLFNERGFLALECDTIISAPNRRDSEFDPDTDDEQDDIPENSEIDSQALVVNSALSIMRNALYLITDMERFRPELPRMRLLKRTYRLLALNSTTPEELYLRKIDNGEYVEALVLAKSYNLDCDLVYQRQWRNARVSTHTIKNYLSKISKKWWVLRQCISRVPDTMDAARDLLLFGLKACSLTVLVEANKETEDTPMKSVDSEINESDQEVLDSTINYDEELLDKINTKNLTENQKELLRFRQILLKYLDRLSTYETIISTNLDYNSSVYEEFRTKTVLQSALKWARNGNWKALNIAFTNYKSSLDVHWLTLLSNLPETLNPNEYSSILPECDLNDDVIDINQKNLREEDWCEKNMFREICEDLNSPDDDSPTWLYEEQPELFKFCGEIDAHKVSEWYKHRARDIESKTGLVDYALLLIGLAKEKNVQDVESLYYDLCTLDCLVYEVKNVAVDLTMLQQSSDLQKCEWLMEATTDATFVDDLCSLLLPFIRREQSKKNLQENEQESQLLQDYLVKLSQEDLTLALKYFEHLVRAEDPSVLLIPEDMMTQLAMDCVYANNVANLEQIKLSLEILECFPEHLQQSDLYLSLNNLYRELLACRLLCTRGVHCIPRELNSMRDDATTAKELLYKLARHVSRMIPPPNEETWDDFLLDLLNIQDTVFNCIPVETVYEIYVSTLLSCGQKEYIRTASDVMECQKTKTKKKHPTKVHQDDGDDNEVSARYVDSKIPYERTVFLVLQAAREYFDSARSLDDPNMELSKTCLLLITDNHDEVQEELDLIAAVQILQDFSVSILPIQVRLCPDRLRLIDSCLTNTVTNSSILFTSGGIAHTQSTGNVILQLSNLLRIYGDDKRRREGAVLEMLAKNTIETRNWFLCSQYCKRLMSGGHKNSWRVLAELARQGESLPTATRLQVLSFAFLHCDVDALEDLYDIRLQLEAIEIKKELNKLTSLYTDDLQSTASSNAPGSADPADPADVDEDFQDALTSPTSPMKEFPSGVPKLFRILNQSENIKDSTLQFISRLGDTHFWNREKGDNGDVDENQEDNERSMSKESYPAFYAEIHPGCLETDVFAKYDRFSNGSGGNRELTVCRLLLRLALIEQDNLEKDQKADLDAVLLQYAQHMLPQDLTLGLGLLLSLSDPYEARHTLDTLPVTYVSLKVSIYYAALQICIERLSRGDTEGAEIYTKRPQEILSMAKSFSDGSTDPHLKSMLDGYLSRLEDLSQADELQSLGCGVDTHRFTLDEEYRRDSILGLAMSPEENRYNLALKLGIRHGVPMWSIAFEHVSSLLQSPDLAPGVLNEKLENSELLELLKQNPDEVCDKLFNQVFPTLDGTQHAVLMYYYTLINKISPEYVTQGLTAKEHCKLIKKVKAACSYLDYTLILNPPDDFVAAVVSSVPQDSLPMISKLLKTLPPPLSEACQVTQSKLHSEWAKKHFFELPAHSTPRQYMSHWSSLKPLFLRMSSEDFKSLVQKVTLSNLALSRIDMETRTQLLREALTICNDRMKENGEEWRQLQSDVTNWLGVFEALGGDSWQEMLPYGEDIHTIIRQIQESCSQPGLLMECLIRLIMVAAIPLHDLSLAIKEMPSAPSLCEALKQMLEDSHSLLGSTDKGTSMLTTVVSRLEEYLSNKLKVDPNLGLDFGSGDWNNDSDWNIDDDVSTSKEEGDAHDVSNEEMKLLAEELLPLCGDLQISPALRLRVMNILEELNIVASDSNTDLLFQHTQATVLSAWQSDTQEHTEQWLVKVLSSYDLSKQSGRVQLFNQLLEVVNNWNQLRCLKDLLQHWPAFEEMEYQDGSSPWYILLEKILTYNEVDKPENTTTILQDVLIFSCLKEEVLFELLHRLEAKISSMDILLICLLKNSGTTTENFTLSELLQYAVEIVKTLKESPPENIQYLLLSRGLIPQLVNTPVYQNLIELSLSAPLLPNPQDTASSTEPDTQIPTPLEITQQLLTAKLFAEAGAFHLTSVGTPGALRSFDATLTWARKVLTSENDD